MGFWELGGWEFEGFRAFGVWGSGLRGLRVHGSGLGFRVSVYGKDWQGLCLCNRSQKTAFYINMIPRGTLV